MSLTVLKQAQLKTGTKTPNSLGQNYHNTTHEIVADDVSRTLWMRSRTRDDGWAVFPFENIDFMRPLSSDVGPGWIVKIVNAIKKVVKGASSPNTADAS